MAGGCDAHEGVRRGGERRTPAQGSEGAPRRPPCLNKPDATAACEALNGATLLGSEGLMVRYATNTRADDMSDDDNNDGDDSDMHESDGMEDDEFDADDFF